MIRTFEDEHGNVTACSDPHNVTFCNGTDCTPPRVIVVHLQRNPQEEAS